MFTRLCDFSKNAFSTAAKKSFFEDGPEKTRVEATGTPPNPVPKRVEEKEEWSF